MKQQKDSTSGTQTDSNKKEIRIALIGLAGVVLTALIALAGNALIAYFSNQAAQAPILIPIQATQTAEAKASSVVLTSKPTDTSYPTKSPSSTPIPPSATTTFTPSPTATKTLTPTLIQTPTFVPGEDFEHNCIDSKIWFPYNGESILKDTRGCWQLRGWGISTQDGGLLLAVEDSAAIPPRSIYTYLPDKAEIHFTLRIDQLTTEKNIDTNLIFGVGNAREGLESGKFIIYRVIYPGSAIKTLYTSSIRKKGEEYFPNYSRGTEQSITLQINGLLLDVYIDNLHVLDSVTLTQADKEVFWIGFWPSVNGDVKAYISNFRLTE